MTQRGQDDLTRILDEMRSGPAPNTDDKTGPLPTRAHSVHGNPAQRDSLVLEPRVEALRSGQ